MRTALTLLALLLAGCSGRQSAAPLQLDGTCPAGSLFAGQQFILRLPATPSTGYRWELSRNAAPQLQQVGEPRFINPQQAGRVGTSGLMLWTFRASTAGSNQLQLDYRRPWDQGVAAERSLRCSIRVHD